MNTPVLRRFLIPAAAFVLLAAAAGCSSVKPWERGDLASPLMNRDRDPLGLALTEHMFFSREATSGGAGIGGGGCGCN